MEEAGLREAVLSEVHTDEGDEFQFDVHLSRAEGSVEGGAGDTVCELWVQGMRVERLSGAYKNGSCRRCRYLAFARAFERDDMHWARFSAKITIPYGRGSGVVPSWHFKRRLLDLRAKQESIEMEKSQMGCFPPVLLVEQVSPVTPEPHSGWITGHRMRRIERPVRGQSRPGALRSYENDSHSDQIGISGDRVCTCLHSYSPPKL